MADPKPTLLRLERPESDLASKRDIARKLDAVISRGAVDWTGEVTLTADGASTSTTVTDERITTDSQLSLQPTTPEAAALVGKVWIDPANITPGTAWSGSEIGTLTVSHPPLVVGVVATFRICIKG